MWRASSSCCATSVSSLSIALTWARLAASALVYACTSECAPVSVNVFFLCSFHSFRKECKGYGKRVLQSLSIARVQAKGISPPPVGGEDCGFYLFQARHNFLEDVCQAGTGCALITCYIVACIVGLSRDSQPTRSVEFARRASRPLASGITATENNMYDKNSTLTRRE